MQHQELPDIPIWFLCMGYDTAMQRLQLGGYNLLKVYKCSMRDIDEIYRTLDPLYRNGVIVNTLIIVRSQEFPFENFAEEWIPALDKEPSYVQVYLDTDIINTRNARGMVLSKYSGSTDTVWPLLKDWMMNHTDKEVKIDRI